MARLFLEQISDFGDYTCGQELTEFFQVTKDDLKEYLSCVRLSPEGRHIHVIQSKPEVGLVTFDKYERPQLLQNQKRLDLILKRTAPVVDILYLGDNDGGSRDATTVAVVYEDGKAEFWKFLLCKNGWHLLQMSDLCNSPRARIVSVCASSNLIIWCEERPPSESSPALSSTRNNLRYCVCRRDFEVEDGTVSLRGVKILLHNNPKFTVVSSGECVHFLPDMRVRPLGSIPSFFLTWSPQHDSFAVGTLCKNTPLKRLSAKESDFKKLVMDCLGFLSTLNPPEIYNCAPSSHGGLLLLFNTGCVSLLQKDGILRQLCTVADNRLMTYGTHTSLCLYEETLALVIGQNLHLIDVKCGRELEKITIKREGLLYMNQAKRCTPHLLLKNGLFIVATKETSCNDNNPKIRRSGFGASEHFHPGALLVEAVFEEACKYYQQRSLSSTQLTVDMLKKGGMFQAPITLASILSNHLSRVSKQKGAELSQNGDVGLTTGQAKLMSSLEAELEALVSLEEVKSNLVKASVTEVEVLSESLVEKEVVRLLQSSSGLDKDAILYLNYIFNMFPCQVWKAAQAALQLHYNGEGSLSSRAPPDVWKTILSPAAMPSTIMSVPVSNGRPEHNHRNKSGSAANCAAKAATPPPPPATLPVFELLCRSVFHFQPSWLPRFLELAQQQQGSAGLGLSLASSSWSFHRGQDGGESNAPLYKRALALLSGLSRDREQQQQLEVELLLVSGRPNAVLQALRMLMAKQQWERVIEVAQEFCTKSPLLNKEIFTTLLCEVSQHRDLDPYLDLLWALCPDDLTVTTILNLVLKNLSSSNTSPSSLSSSFPFALPNTSSSPAPFVEPQSGQLTIGLLKPLLRKVLQREAKPSQHYADILRSPSFPPPVPPRRPTEQPRTIADPNTETGLSADDVPSRLETPEQQPPAATCPPSAC